MKRQVVDGEGVNMLYNRLRNIISKYVHAVCL